MKAWLLVLVVAACGDNVRLQPDGNHDASLVPALRNPVDLSDDQLAKQSLAILGAATSTKCAACHGLTRQTIHYWRAQSDRALSECLTDLAISDDTNARAMLDCARVVPSSPASDFSATKLGIYAAATHLPWFQFAATRGYGDGAEPVLAQLRMQAGMPRGDRTPLAQEELDIVAEWFARGVPRLDANLSADPPPTTCTPGISSAVGAHVTAMATTGWRAINKTNALAMYGCGSATDPRDCLTSEPLASDQPYGIGWDVPNVGVIRVLHDATYVSQFWTRGSPDGRFIAHGVDTVMGSYVQDLARDVQVPIAGEWDPAFFPDNSGFSYQGSLRNTCAMSVLTSNPSSVTMTEAGCARILTLGQYQHMAAAVGGDYFAADSQYVGDDGGKVETVADPFASFTVAANVDITPMIFDGTTFVPKPYVRIGTPFEGDVAMSPSARLLISRVAGPGDLQLGYVLRRLDATPSGDSYAFNAPEIARYCVNGGKPAFSYDERWITFHHYEPYGAANLFLMDLTTGTVTRITDMPTGQYALFPHFRSDGWIYAQVRDAAAGHEYTIATDAALVAE